MRTLILLFICACLFADTDQNIKNNEEKLQNISNKASAINVKLKTLGKNINDKNKKIKELNIQIKNIETNININQKLSIEQEQVFNNFTNKYEELNIKLKSLQKELIDVVLKDMTIIMILNSKEPLNEDSIINEEILKNISKSAKDSIQTIINEQEIVKKDIQNVKNKIDSAKKIINSQKEKKQNLEIVKNEQEKLADKLNKELEAYNNELKKLDKERISIQNILIDLNILKKQELQKQEKDALFSKRDSANLAPLDVRKIGSSYRDVSTTTYKGVKTIAPLKEYSVETKYGPYFDPVYKMRIFNEFITFSVKKKSAVMSVLDGKIVFAKDTPMLKKVVVVEHKNGLHTIYSYLDEIGNIKIGSTIKKGSIIAYINEKLNFEVTQKDKHINPLQLIKVK
ncbi:murein hydrolase activator EnvC [Helicobacter sp. MIT 14-3879]|uniref:murein hydrolase activator EnvC family protein n=1 Tax=Helicobacter sp. MIT 14-3879 TaxID=2040649 RepID=UPI000E1E3738|nr:peptidoglycan DD-metalloendopeptidase family protein [Helicobacter sp. MIT 14-3879]RDU64733.1 metallopeptidase [Helicobacter sp. MIT 14-3879]